MEHKFPTEIIELPSQGYFYPESSPLSSGNIELKYMTAKEEDILTSKNLIQKGIVIDTLLKCLIVTPIDYNSLLIGDKNAILVAARILAYGKDYDVDVTCPKCESKKSVVIDLTTFQNKEIDLSQFTKGSRIFSYTLPHCKKTIQLQLFTHQNETDVSEELKALKKLGNNNGIDHEMTTRLRHLIVSVDGDSKRETINHFVSSELLSLDSKHLRGYIKKHTPDVDMTHFFECQTCGEVSGVSVPLTTDFFWPTSRE